LSDDEVRRLLAAVDTGDGEAARRDAALIRLMLGTGLRLSSALSLTSDDVDTVRNEISVRKVKNDAPLVLPIGSAVSRELRTWLRTVRTVRTVFLFAGPSGQPLTRRQAGRRIEIWAAEAGLARRATAHSFRHTFGQRLYARSRDLLVVQAGLGHASVQSSTIYARLDRAALRAALAN
jgi:site-specific recombinase XerD